MFLRSIELTNFRSFRRAEIELGDGPTVIVGDNGQGKTNLLEAIELLATAKSARAGSDRELINWRALTEVEVPLPEPFARIRAVVTRGSRELRAEILVRTAENGTDSEGSAASKVFRLNGLPKRALEFVGAINVVAFAPLDVALVDGGPSGRRRHLDVMNSQASSHYLRELQRYQKVLLQRNHLLREARGRGVDESTLGAWTDQLITVGSFLMLERARALAELGPLTWSWFRELRGAGQSIVLQYRPGLGVEGDRLRNLPDAEDQAQAEVKSAFGQALEQVRRREAAAGMSLMGPHRDDFRFLLDGVDLAIYGSRGQQRLAALALKLAEADLLERRAGSRPIVLMDDVLSELDPSRQKAVLEYVGRGGQTILTLTSLDAVNLENWPMSVVRVSEGKLYPMEGSERSL